MNVSFLCWRGVLFNCCGSDLERQRERDRLIERERERERERLVADYS